MIYVQIQCVPHAQIAQTAHHVFNQQIYQVQEDAHVLIIIIIMEALVIYVQIQCVPHVQIAQTVHHVLQMQFYQILVIVHVQIIIIGMGLNVHYVMIHVLNLFKFYILFRMHFWDKSSKQWYMYISKLFLLESKSMFSM